MKRIVPFGRVLERAGEDLAAGHVAPAVGVDPGAAVDAQAQVGALGLDADLRAPWPDARRGACWRSLSSRQAADRVGAVEEQRAVTNAA